MAGIRDSISPGSSRKINFANLILRILQLIFAVVVIAFYGYYLKQTFIIAYETDYKAKASLAVAVGSLSIITAIAFTLIPALVSYYCVAIAFIWEFIIFFIWCAVFGWFKGQLGIKYADQEPLYKDDYIKFAQFTWIVLVNMLLWLATALMGVFCLLHDRMSLNFGRSGV